MLRGSWLKRGRLACLALLCCLLPALALAGPGRQDWATVLHINDGDTITISLAGHKRLVRLLGVDAPETGHSRKLERAARKARRTPEQEARLGGSAREFVAGLLNRGDRVRLQADLGAGEQDSHGRLLAYVYLEDGRMLNALLLQEGQARVYGRCQCAWLENFRGLEAKARAQRRGLWSQGGP